MTIIKSITSHLSKGYPIIALLYFALGVALKQDFETQHTQPHVSTIEAEFFSGHASIATARKTDLICVKSATKAACQSVPAPNSGVILSAPVSSVGPSVGLSACMIVDDKSYTLEEAMALCREPLHLN